MSAGNPAGFLGDGYQIEGLGPVFLVPAAPQPWWWAPLFRLSFFLFGCEGSRFGLNGGGEKIILRDIKSATQGDS